MTTLPETDPRIGALMDLTQGLILKYTELASNVAAHLPDQVKAELIEHTQTLVQEARDRRDGLRAAHRRVRHVDSPQRCRWRFVDCSRPASMSFDQAGFAELLAPAPSVEPRGGPHSERGPQPSACLTAFLSAISTSYRPVPVWAA
jgi:hypothetical protein